MFEVGRLLAVLEQRPFLDQELDEFRVLLEEAPGRSGSRARHAIQGILKVDDHRIHRLAKPTHHPIDGREEQVTLAAGNSGKAFLLPICNRSTSAWVTVSEKPCSAKSFVAASRISSRRPQGIDVVAWRSGSARALSGADSTARLRL